MPTCSLEIPASPIARMAANEALAGVGSVAKQLLEARILAYGAIPGVNVYDWAYDVITVAAGAPGTTTVDLTALITPDGSSLAALAGKLIYLEIVRLTGAAADGAVRRSAANPVPLLSGATDTLTLRGGHAVLIDVLKTSTTLITDGYTFGAAAKNIDIESTVGGTFAILACVV